jgi:hypothetical protein
VVLLFIDKSILACVSPHIAFPPLYPCSLPSNPLPTHPPLPPPHTHTRSLLSSRVHHPCEESRWTPLLLEQPTRHPWATVIPQPLALLEPPPPSSKAPAAAALGPVPQGRPVPWSRSPPQGIWTSCSVRVAGPTASTPTSKSRTTPEHVHCDVSTHKTTPTHPPHPTHAPVPTLDVLLLPYHSNQL